MTAPPASPEFDPTRWTLVLRARGPSSDAQAALSELCETYYPPVLRFLGREGRDEDAARELAQGFFARVLSQGGFDEADPERGRFRSYLLGALKHFLADQRKHEQRQKRGHGVLTESLDAPAGDEDSGGREVADVSVSSPDQSFDREWALTVMGRALSLLEKEFSVTGKGEQFQVLKPWLVGEVEGQGAGPALSQAEAARRLGLSEGAVKVLVHRLRKRFRDAVRLEISHTLRERSLVDEELRHLIDALS
jgi:RNA polymerase sigma-70 factor (ECF subfamily)